MKSQSDFSQRVVTALIGVTLFLGVLLLGGFWGAVFLSALISAAMLYEFGMLTFSLKDRKSKITALTVASIFAQGLSALHEPLWVEFYTFFGALLLAYFLFSSREFREKDFTTHSQEAMFGIFGFFYLSFFMSFFSKIRDLEQGLLWLVFYFLVIWSMDVGAYLVGKRIGRIKLFPSVSPKKTVEGLFGGMILAGIVGWAFAYFYMMERIDLPSYFQNYAALLLALGVGATSQVGDLIESMFKRAFHKKDSGSLLPGHGGFLDRFDGVVFTLPLMYTCARFLMEGGFTFD